METNENFWNRFDRLRGGMSVREVANRLGISESSLQSTRVVKQMPKTRWLYLFSKLFGVSMEYMYTGEAEKLDDGSVFKRIESDPRLMDICEALLVSSDQEIEMVARMLQVKKDTSTSKENIVG